MYGVRLHDEVSQIAASPRSDMREHVSPARAPGIKINLVLVVGVHERRWAQDIVFLVHQE
jgi:hypothetical protein